MDQHAQIPVSHLKDADMRGVPAALVRAQQRAREIAAQTGTPLIVRKDGVLIEQHIARETVIRPSKSN